MSNLELAQDLNTSSETLSVLATDDKWNIRYWVAKNSNTPSETLSVLATDDKWNIRYWVARNPNTPLYVKQYLYYYEQS